MTQKFYTIHAIGSESPVWKMLGLDQSFRFESADAAIANARALGITCEIWVLDAEDGKDTKRPMRLCVVWPGDVRG